MKRATFSPAFEAWYSYLQSVEGGVIDHDLDNGGATWHGISSRFLESIGRQGPISKGDAKLIAYDYFWEGIGAESMAPVVAWCYADAYFNHRPDAAVKLMQSALGVKQDGIVGPATRTAAGPNAVNARLFWEQYASARTALYTRLVKADSTQLAFLTGWNNRVRRLGQAMLVAGLAEPDLQAMPWYRKAMESAGPGTKATGIGVLSLGGLLALFAPDIDIDSVRELVNNPDALKATLGGFIAALIARLKLK